MTGNSRHARATVPALAGAAIATTLAAFPGTGAAQEDSGPRIVMPLPDAEHGRFLFVSKGCIVCHAVNFVGGTAAPPLDAPEDGREIDPLDFAARMWRGAVAMTVLQSTEFGYQIELTGEEIADLAAFAASPEVQATFSEDHIPEVMRGWTLDESWEELMEQLRPMPEGESPDEAQ